MTKRWIFKEQPDEVEVASLSQQINVNACLSAILLQRGIKNFEEAKTFFRPSLDQLHDPFLMKDMDLAVKRIKTAIENGEKILVYGDYDVDGTTSVTLMYGFLK